MCFMCNHTKGSASKWGVGGKKWAAPLGGSDTSWTDSETRAQADMNHHSE